MVDARLPPRCTEPLPGADRGDRRRQRGQRRRATWWCSAAGCMPGDLHKLWRARDPKGYHVEYGYSCMGYEIAGGLGVKLAAPDREVFVMVGDGSYLMMSQETRHRGGRGHQAHRGPRAEPRLRLDRRAVGVAWARSGSAPPTATASADRDARRRQPAGRPRRQRREPGRRRAPGPDHRGVPGRAGARPRARPGPRWCTSRPTRWPRRRDGEPGGTCRSPRSRSWPVPSGPARPTNRPNNVKGSTCERPLDPAAAGQLPRLVGRLVRGRPPPDAVVPVPGRTGRGRLPVPRAGTVRLPAHRSGPAGR